MAESSDNDENNMDKLADDLDSMLDETDVSTKQADQAIDDEDAIDRLLMDNAFDGPDQAEPDEFAEVDELISDSLADSDDQGGNQIEEVVDEFADEEDFLSGMDENPAEAVASEESEIDDIIDEAVENVEQQAIDELPSDKSMSEIDEISDLEVEQNDSPDEDDLINEFDISADEPTSQVDENIRQEDSSFNQSPATPEEVELPEDKGNSGNEKNEVAFAEINTQLAALQSVQGVMQQQISDIGSSDDSIDLTDEVNDLQTYQKKLNRKLIALEEKKPVLAYAAIALAILALLVGTGLGMVGFGADSKVSDVSNLVINIEEELADLSAREKPEKYNELSQRIGKMDTEVANFSAELAKIKQAAAGSDQSETEELNKKIAELGKQNMQMGATVEALQKQFDALKNKKIIAKTVPKTVRKKAVVSKKQWAVNLISFKQEWYAKRKAAEFEKKGIPVEVMKAQIKGSTWNRLRVKGFKSKYEAAAYAAKVKKSLNLTGVWVAND